MRKKDRLLETVGIVLKVAGVSLLTMWSFFDFSVYSVGVLLLAPVEMARERKKKRKEKIRRLNLAFRDAMLYLRNALTAGYSPEGGMKEALKGLEQLYSPNHRICLEFRRMVSQMELGSSMEEVWLSFGERSGSEDIRQFAEIFSVVKRTGGDLGTVLYQTSEVIQDKIELSRELYTTLAARETEFRMMCIIPHGILLYLQFFAPSMCESLYHNAFGIAFMWIIFLFYSGIRFAGEGILQKGIAR